jgi:HSP20 family molecular chaperone IbpA
MVRRPASEVREEGGALLVSASIAGIDPGDIRVEVTPQDVVIRDVNELNHVHPLARLHQSECRAGRLFRSVHLPFAILGGHPKRAIRAVLTCT